MTHKEMFGDAKWVAPALSCEAPYVRGTFQAERPCQARITICGLGFFELYCNGKRVAEDYFVPAYSDYEKRENKGLNYPLLDVQSHRTYVMRYDLTPLLKDGNNVIGVLLGNGWYHQDKHHDENTDTYGRIRLCYSLEVEDQNGTSVYASGTSLRWKESYITNNNLYFGETHDYRLYDEEWLTAGYDDSTWNPVELVDSPRTEFYLQDCPPDRICETLTPTVVKVFDDVTVYDLGKNVSGFVVVETADGKVGEQVVVKHAENIHADGTLDMTSCDGIRQPQVDTYIIGQLKSRQSIEMHPHFSWHGFRYFSLTRSARPLYGAVVHADVRQSSDFSCDDETLNWLYRAYVNTQLCNMHAGVPSDCPHIERLGYTGDGQLCADAAMLLLDAKEFYKKWMEDIADCQDMVTGHVQHTAPFAGGGGGPGGWGCAIVEVPYVFYRHYADPTVLERYLPNMMAYLNYMEDHSEGGLVVREETGGWCLGDWCAPDGVKIPEAFVNTYFYIKSMMRMLEIVDLLDRPSVRPVLEKRIARCKQAILHAYYSEQSHNFIGNVQGANSFALDLGLGTDQTYQNTRLKYEALGQYDTGIFGTDILTRILFERGDAALAYRLLASQKDNSYYNMKRQGATTLWEYWHGARSHSHPMFGAAVRYLFYYLLGIRQNEGTAGFERITVCPGLVPELKHVKGFLTTQKGKISVCIDRADGTVKIAVDLAEGMEAQLVFAGLTHPLVQGHNEFKFPVGQNCD